MKAYSSFILIKLLFHCTSVKFKLIDGISSSHNEIRPTLSNLQTPSLFTYCNFENWHLTTGNSSLPNAFTFRRALARYHFSSQHWDISLPSSWALNISAHWFLYTCANRHIWHIKHSWSAGKWHWACLPCFEFNTHHALITFEKGRWRWKNKFSMVFGLLKYKTNRKKPKTKLSVKEQKNAMLSALQIHTTYENKIEDGGGKRTLISLA